MNNGFETLYDVEGRTSVIRNNRRTALTTTGAEIMGGRVGIAIAESRFVRSVQQVNDDAFCRLIYQFTIGTR